MVTLPTSYRLQDGTSPSAPVSPANTSDRPNLTKSHEALRATRFRTTIDPTSDLGRGPGGRGSGARIELAYGTWLRRRRRGIECRTPLRSAAVTLEQIRATGRHHRGTPLAGPRPQQRRSALAQILESRRPRLPRDARVARAGPEASRPKQRRDLPLPPPTRISTRATTPSTPSAWHRC